MLWTKQEKLAEEVREKEQKIKEYKTRVLKYVAKYADGGRYDRADEIIRIATERIREELGTAI